MSLKSPDEVARILQRWLAPLQPGLPPVYLVGGAVRDLMLQRPLRDIDLMTAAPQQLARRLADAHSAAVVPFLKKADAPCFRVVRLADKNDFLDLVPIHGGSVEADLKQRDFTINAMALAVATADWAAAQPLDPLDGRADLIRRIVRATSPAAFNDDPLRILRAARFAAELDFTIEDNTLKAMQAAAARLAAVSAERITHELLLILEQPAGARHLRTLDATGALAVILPEIAPMKGCGQNHYHHLDVWDHSLLVVQNLEMLLVRLEDFFGATAARIRTDLGGPRRLALLKLAALLHDIGKPATRNHDPISGRTQFIGHARTGAAMVEEITRRLKLSAADAKLPALLVGDHMQVRDLADPAVKPATVTKWFRRLGTDMVPLLLLSIADTLSVCGPAADPTARANYLEWVKTTLQTFYTTLQPRLTATPLIDGHDLLAMGIARGPQIGRILKAVQAAQDQALITTRQQALDLAAQLSATPFSPT